MRKDSLYCRGTALLLALLLCVSLLPAAAFAEEAQTEIPTSSAAEEAAEVGAAEEGSKPEAAETEPAAPEEDLLPAETQADPAEPAAAEADSAETQPEDDSVVAESIPSADSTEEPVPFLLRIDADALSHSGSLQVTVSVSSLPADYDCAEIIFEEENTGDRLSVLCEKKTEADGAANHLLTGIMQTEAAVPGIYYVSEARFERIEAAEDGTTQRITVLLYTARAAAEAAEPLCLPLPEACEEVCFTLTGTAEGSDSPAEAEPQETPAEETEAAENEVPTEDADVTENAPEEPEETAALAANAAEPMTLTAQNESDGVRLKWNKVSGAKYYVLYRREEDGDWVEWKQTEACSYKDKRVESGTRYSYAVRAWGSRIGWTPMDEEGCPVQAFSVPKLLSLTNESEGLCLRWTGVNAERYEILFWTKVGKTNGWQHLAYTEGSEAAEQSWTDASAQPGAVRSYTVRAVSTDGGSMGLYNSKGLKTTRVEAPEGLTAEGVSGGIQLNWQAAAGAKKYILYRRPAEGGSYKKIADTAKLSWKDSSAKAGVLYHYLVIGTNGTAKSADSGGADMLYLAQPKLLRAENAWTEENGHALRVCWEKAIAGAEAFEILRRAEDGSWTPVGRAPADALFWTDTSDALLYGCNYAYTVRAVNDSFGVNGPYDGRGKSILSLEAPKPESITANSSSVRFCWSPVGDESLIKNYAVYRRSVGSANWQKIGSTKPGICSWTDKNARAGTLCEYRVCSVNGSTQSAFMPETLQAVVLSKVDLSKTAAVCAAADGESGVRLTWGAVKGAQTYTVLRKTGDVYAPIAEKITETSWFDTDLTPGETVTYTVAAAYGDYCLGDYNSKGKTIVFYPGPAELTGEERTDGIYLSWGAVPQAEGYRIWRRAAATKNAAWKSVGSTDAEDACVFIDRSAAGFECYDYTVTADFSTGSGPAGSGSIAASLTRQHTYLTYDKVSGSAESCETYRMVKVGDMRGQDGDFFDGSFWKAQVGENDKGGTVVKLRAYPADSFMRTGTLLTLDRSGSLTPHCNSLCFRERENETWLYANVYNSYEGQKNLHAGECLVYRIGTDSKGQYTSSLTQQIKIGFTDNEALWPADWQSRPYGNFIVDEENDLLYVYVMDYKADALRWFTFALPDPEAGAVNKNGWHELTLTEEMLLADWQTEMGDVIQGCCVYNGRIWTTEGGYYSNGGWRAAIRVIDPEEQKTVMYFDLSGDGLAAESEAIAARNGEIYYASSRALYRLELLEQPHEESADGTVCLRCGRALSEG